MYICSVKLSIIIPVYCVEQTLERCIESVIGQEYEDMEIILVDDGSPDLSPQICDQWGGKDSRIIVVHKKNGGLSSARNAGIERATGEYITFVDSDDYLAPGTYKAVMATIQPEFDIVEFPVFNEKTKAVTGFRQKIYRNRDDYWLKGKAYQHAFAWNKIYKRVLFKEVRFPEGRVFEDIATLPLLLEHAKTISTTDKGMYFYTWNPRGITASAKGHSLKMLLEAHTSYMQKYPIDDVYYMHVLNIQMDVCRLTGDAPVLKTRIIKSARHLEHKLKIKAILLNFLGINILCKLNKAIFLLTRDR